MKIELFKDAIAIIDGIPSERVRLRFWQDDVRASPEDKKQFFISKPKHIVDTLRCCPGGWLALHPKMRELGLRTWRKDAGEPQFACLSGFDALAAFFDIKTVEAIDLFHPQWSNLQVRISEKRRWAHRAYKLLAKYARGEDEQARYSMLAADLLTPDYQLGAPS